MKAKLDSKKSLFPGSAGVVLCAVVVALAANSQAIAQTSTLPMAYNVESVFFSGTGCNSSGEGRNADCVLDGASALVTPWTSLMWAYHPTWSPDATQIAFTDAYDIFVIAAADTTAFKLYELRKRVV